MYQLLVILVSACLFYISKKDSYRYVQFGSRNDKYTFRIFGDSCGSELVDDKTESTISNTLVFQMDPSIQEIWDRAHKISCTWTTRQTKKIEFRPLSVSMLDVVTANFEGDNIKCWMEIKKGIYPNTSPLDPIVGIGEQLSLIIYVQDDMRPVDVGVRDCWAYGGQPEEDPSVIRVQLTSERGCSLKDKIISDWDRTITSINSVDTVVSYTNMTAFKFPDKSQIFVTCNVEICVGRCHETCRAIPHMPPITTTEKPPTIIKVTTTVPTSPQNLGNDLKCVPRSSDPRCNFRCLPGSTDPSCITIRSKDESRKTGSICVPGSTDQLCREERLGKQITKSDKENWEKGEKCFLGSDDPRCYQNRRIQPQRPTKEFICKINPKDPVCRKVQLNRPDCRPGTADESCANWEIKKSKCLENPNDPSCFNVPKQSLGKSLNQQQPIKINCLVDKNNPKCRSLLSQKVTEKQFISLERPCGPGDTRPKCLKTSIPAQVPQVKSFTCTSNSRDPRCPSRPRNKTVPKATSNPLCTLGIDAPFCDDKKPIPTFTNQKSCVKGRDGKCLPNIPVTNSEKVTSSFCTRNPAHKRCQTVVKGIESFSCSPGSKDPRCTLNPALPDLEAIVPDCAFGSTDRRCLKKQITVNEQADDCIETDNFNRCVELKKQNCVTGSKESRCLSLIENWDKTCKKDPSDPLCSKKVSPKVSVSCNPNSKDPRCHSRELRVLLKPRTEKLSFCQRNPKSPACVLTISKNVDKIKFYECKPGSDDPRCEKISKSSQKVLCSPGSKDVRCQNFGKSLHIESKNPCRIDPTSPDCAKTPEKMPEVSVFISCLSNPRQPHCLSMFLPKVSEEGNSKSSINQFCQQNPLNSQCIKISQSKEIAKNVNPPANVIRQRICLPNSKDPDCLKVPVLKTTINCLQNSQDPRCFEFPVIKTSPKCEAGSTLPGCINVPDLNKKINCFLGSKDPRCSKMVITKPKTTKINCNRDPNNPLCFDTTTDGPAITCLQGSTDLRCKNVPSIEPVFECKPGSKVPGCIDSPKIGKKLECKDDSNDPQCSKTLKHSQKCGQGETGSHCEETVDSSQRCTPGSKDPHCISHEKVQVPITPAFEATFKCQTGSKDPRCIFKSFDGKQTICTSGNCRVPPVTETKKCSVGSLNPKCKQIEEKHSAIDCSLHSESPLCSSFTRTPGKCSKDSQDPKCHTKPILPPITIERGCTKDSTDPKCKSPKEISEPSLPHNWPCKEGSKDPKCSKINPPTKMKVLNFFVCPEGTTDPRCKSLCIPGNNDPKCLPQPKIPLSQSKIRLPQPKKRLPPPKILLPQPKMRLPQPKIPQVKHVVVNCDQETDNPLCNRFQIIKDKSKNNCTPGSRDPNCRDLPGRIDEIKRCQPGSTDSKCKNKETVKHISKCTPGSRSPECISNISNNLNCDKNPDDPRCHFQITGSPVPKPIIDCKLLPKHPQCFQNVVRNDVNCLKVPFDPKCKKLIPKLENVEVDCNQFPKDEKCKIKNIAKELTSQPNCSLNPNHPRCINRPEIKEESFSCKENSEDPRCVTKTIPNRAPKENWPCEKGSTNPKCKTGQPKELGEHELRCKNSPSDPRCINIELEQPPKRPIGKCIKGSKDPRCTEDTTEHGPHKHNWPCKPGSTDPKCKVVTIPHVSSTPDCTKNPSDPKCQNVSNAPKEKVKPIGTHCSIHPDDPLCKIDLKPAKNKCGYGSTDPECLIDSTESVKAPVVCIPGSSHPDCLHKPSIVTAIGCSPFSTDPKCISKKNIKPQTQTQSPPVPAPRSSGAYLNTKITTPTPNAESSECSPGSKRPECLRKEKEIPEDISCSPGSGDPRCAEESRQQKEKRIPLIGESEEKLVPQKPRRPVPRMMKKDDFHGKDADPRYHAFHSWLYQPAPRPRNPHGRGKRNVPNEPHTILQQTFIMMSSQTFLLLNILIFSVGFIIVLFHIYVKNKPKKCIEIC